MVKSNMDWSNLPPEILHLICKKLPDIYEFVVFHAVCKTWRSCECEPPLQLPWILEDRRYPDNPNLRFYSLSSGKILTITCVKSRNKCFLGSSYHYLVAYHRTEIGFLWSLLNPLTSDEIYLPQLKKNIMYCVEWIRPDPTGAGEQNASFSMCSNGAPNPCSHTMVLCWLEDQETAGQFRLQGMNGNGTLCYNREFFFVDRLTGVTKVKNIATKKLVYELPPIDPAHYYWYWMVESEGDILLLRKMCDPDHLYFDIYRVDLRSDKGSASWVEVADIDEQVLFLDEYRGSSFCAREYKGLGENCIYYLKGDFLYKYDIKDSTAESLYCPFVGRNKTWFTPSLYWCC